VSCAARTEITIFSKNGRTNCEKSSLTFARMQSGIKERKKYRAVLSNEGKREIFAILTPNLVSNYDFRSDYAWHKVKCSFVVA